jgi:hypothetical protein
MAEMRLKKHRGRILILASYLAIGGLITQFSACWIIGANTLIAPVTANLIDANGNLFGVFNVCGVPDTVAQDANGMYGTVQNTEDDLVTVCPVTVTQITTSGT